MSVILKNSSNATIYTFPGGIDLVDEPFFKRLDTEPRAYAHGAVLAGDEKVGVRIVSLHGIFGKASQALMEAELNSMKKACYTEDLRLYATQFSNDYHNVECLNFEHSFLGKLTAVEINVDFQCADPFRYYKDETSDDETVAEASHSYVIANGGDIEVFPVITFTAGVGASISKIAITNVTDAGKSFEYTPAASLVATNIVEVDCQNGTVELNTGAGLADDIAHWTGRFIRLKSGNNDITIAITGDVGTNQCVFAFRHRWL